MYLPQSVISIKDCTKYFVSASLLLCSALMTTSLFAQEQINSSTQANPDSQFNSEPKPTLKLGEATSNLLSLQVSGTASSPPLPMLGVTSNLSWQRYLESFKYKIPESFENKVSKTDN